MDPKCGSIHWKDKSQWEIATGTMLWAKNLEWGSGNPEFLSCYRLHREIPQAVLQFHHCKTTQHSTQRYSPTASYQYAPREPPLVSVGGPQLWDLPRKVDKLPESLVISVCREVQTQPSRGSQSSTAPDQSLGFIHQWRLRAAEKLSDAVTAATGEFKSVIMGWS